MPDFASVKAKVTEILKNSQEARNSDNVLLLLYWTQHDDKVFQKVIDIIGVDKIKQLTNYDSIRRVRQEIQNVDGLYKPDPETQRLRLERQAEIKKHYAEKKTPNSTICTRNHQNCKCISKADCVAKSKIEECCYSR